MDDVWLYGAKDSAQVVVELRLDTSDSKQTHDTTFPVCPNTISRHRAAGLVSFGVTSGWPFRTSRFVPARNVIQFFRIYNVMALFPHVTYSMST